MNWLRSTMKLYLNKAEIAAFIIDTNPELANREKLAELSGILSPRIGSDVFDQSGEQVATNSPYTRFTVSDDPEDQSYEFNKLLLGVDSLVQEAQPDDVSGDFHQYIGVTLRDEQNNPNGFVQISVIPSRLEVTEEKHGDRQHPLRASAWANGGVVFAVDKEDGTIAYHPNSRYIGRDAYAYGITEDAVVDGYTGYVAFAGTRHFASALETDRYIVFAAVPEANIGTARLPVTLMAGAASFVALLLVILMLCLYRDKPGKAVHKGKEEKKYGKTMVDVVMPDGSVKKTENPPPAAGATSFIGWADKTPEQKLFSVLRGLLGVFAVVICLAVLMRDQFFDESSVFLFVLNGNGRTASTSSPSPAACSSSAWPASSHHDRAAPAHHHGPHLRGPRVRRSAACSRALSSTSPSSPCSTSAWRCSASTPQRCWPRPVSSP